MIKFYLTILLSLLLPSMAFAVTGNVTLDNSINLVLPSTGEEYELYSASVFDSLDVTSGTFSFELGNGQSAKITNANRRPLTNSQSVSTVCGADKSEVVISVAANTATTTVTITPGTGTCGTSSSSASTAGGGSPSVGGGGGGGGYAPVIPSQTGIPAPVVAQTPAPVVVALAQASVVAMLTQDLFLGSENNEVLQLQAWLAADQAVYPEGKITGYFGNLTAQAVKRFQAKYGIPQIGRVGPMTRSKLNEIFGKAIPAEPKAPEVAKPSPIAQAVSPVFNSGLGTGSRSDDVKRLQQLLNMNADTQVASSEVGSAGNETNYFGPATEKAVKKFQEKYGIAKPGDAGYGYVGPKTRSKLVEVYGGAASPAPVPVPVIVPAPTVSAPVPAPTPISNPAIPTTPSTQESVPDWMKLMPVPRAGGASVVDPTSGTVSGSSGNTDNQDIPEWMKLKPASSFGF